MFLCCIVCAIVLPIPSAFHGQICRLHVVIQFRGWDGTAILPDPA